MRSPKMSMAALQAFRDIANGPPVEPSQSGEMWMQFKRFAEGIREITTTRTDEFRALLETLPETKLTINGAEIDLTQLTDLNYYLSARNLCYKQVPLVQLFSEHVESKVKYTGDSCTMTFHIRPGHELTAQELLGVMQSVFPDAQQRGVDMTCAHNQLRCSYQLDDAMKDRQTDRSLISFLEALESDKLASRRRQ